MSIPKIIQINNSNVKFEDGVPENIISGNPKTKLLNAYTDQTNSFYGGKWCSTVGKWSFEQVGEEYCHILKGKVRLVSANDDKTFGPGDCFVIPDGWKGTWETLETLEKYYVMMERKIPSKL
eukprot:TRINITY_DN11538_c0_g1_i1.p1 TRINITY_DN11538_c0_g1~~TRINITY_DN11538_c0_g1_i1.p1  ORF type:complete len:122 (+),score=28.16 TRINITY_DN11538_c0_g1_i1:28-393(+)